MKNIIDDINFEESIQNSLKSYGYLFPDSDEQMEICEEEIDIIDLPEKFSTPNFVFNGDKVKKPTPVKQLDNNADERNWAIAARDGENLPQSILDKMKRDKENAIKNGNK